MPYYDFRCTDCHRPNRFFYTFQAYTTAEPICTHCGSAKLTRRIGRIAVATSDDSRMDKMLDTSMMAALDAEDPRALGKFMRQMSAETGEELGDEFGEVVDRLEKGQAPEEIEKVMPEIGNIE